MMMMILHTKLLFITCYDNFVMAARVVLILTERQRRPPEIRGEECNAREPYKKRMCSYIIVNLYNIQYRQKV